MIHLREINEDNFEACLNLKVGDSQKSFVANNMFSLAQAWLYDSVARPFAIYADDTMVGFLMLEYDERKKVCGLWRFMIDAQYQGKGYGKEALECVLAYIKTNPGFEAVNLSFEPENIAAEKLYRQYGFLPTGEMDGSQIIMALKLR